jgi:hypothetical protein
VAIDKSQESTRTLINYWTRGEGAAKIRWGVDGSFSRCVRHLSSKVRDPKGLCAELHHEATGEWPAEKGVESSTDPATFDVTDLTDDEWQGLAHLNAVMNSGAGIRYRGPIAMVEKPTGDRRMFAENSLSFRSLPRPANFQILTNQGHAQGVTVAKLERAYMSDGAWWGEGRFLDPRMVPEVPRAVYLLKEKVIGPSVDVSDVTYEIVPHPTMASETAVRFTKGKVMGFTLVAFPAFAEVEILVDDFDSFDALTAAGVPIHFAVNNNNWKRMPLGPRDQDWNADDAIGRLIEWSGGTPNKFRTAFLYVDDKGEPTSRDSYRLPIADVIGGKLVLMPRAVYAAAALLSGAHGGLPNIEDGEKDRLRDVITEIYSLFQETWNDPRVKPPWLRGGRDQHGEPLATIDLPLNTEREETIRKFLDGTLDLSTGWCAPSDIIYDHERAAPIVDMPDVRVTRGGIDFADGEPNMDEPDAGKLNQAARRQAAAKGWAMKDGSYPIRDADHHGAEDLAKAIRAVGRGNAPHDEIRAHIMKRARALGLADEIPDNWTGDSRQAAAAPVQPPAAWFQNPNLTGPTPLTVDEDGRVYGHLAAWNVCHTGIGNRCIMAPKSNAAYRHFKVGSLLLDSGDTIPVGKITLGGGHADPQLGYIPAAEHYDNSCAAVAVVTCGEDKHGIWVAGATVAGLDEERIAELRRSPLSGDWRRINGSLELVAALAVNSPGFPVLRASAEDLEVDETLLAAGIVVPPRSTPANDGNGNTPEHHTDLSRIARLQALDETLQDLARRDKRLRVKSLFGEE